ncbi:MAG: hypothetical protein JOZ83_06030 [Silvibacterium sp.]|nr:hypothetical protein [Silvibacterium sp.]
MTMDEHFAEVDRQLVKLRQHIDERLRAVESALIREFRASLERIEAHNASWTN